MSWRRLLLGRPLANREEGTQRIGAAAGVPAMGLDALGSSAYGPEAALTILAPLGAAGLAYIAPLTLVILLLLAILFFSYRQTIRAYPRNGGSYIVAKENLGTNAGLLAATALMIDYVLNVAVGISAGIGAVVSAAPLLQPYTLALCLLALAVITLANLRGTKEAGLVFAVPTYVFIASFMLILGLGLARTMMADGRPTPVLAPPAIPPGVAAAGAWLLLRAFAAGCTAMTGVEAVSNGVGAFREPSVKHAHRTLTAIVVMLGLLLAGIALLARAYGIGAMNQTQPGYQSVLSQLAGAVIGRSPLYYVAIGSLFAVLSLSANTSFVGFPRLCRLVARDEFLPRAFAIPGRRLVYSIGILFLAGSAGLLLVVFDGITDRLIPLFAVGAFLAFTLSQAGMAAHWRRRLARDDAARGRDRLRLAINGFGAIATGIALAVIIAAKFLEGAWVTIVVIPCGIALLRTIKSYYAELARQLREAGPIDLQQHAPPVVVIPTERWNRLTDKALHFALRLSPDVVAVHLVALEGPDIDEGQERRLRREWHSDVVVPARVAGLNPPDLVVIRSPYRRFLEPLLALIAEIERRHPMRPIAVLIPEVVKTRWWEHLLHSHRARSLRRALLRHGGQRLVVVNVPWYLERTTVEDLIAEREELPAPAHAAGS